MSKTVKVKIGEQPVVSKTALGGYPPNSVVEIPEWEAERIVAGGLGTRTTSQKEPVVKHEDITVNADKTLKTGGSANG